jgi:hypothetical protein
MAVQTITTSVGTTAVPILTGQPFSMPGTAPVVVSNLGSNPVFLGGPAVTATTGVQVAAGANLALPGGADVYAIAAVGPNNVVVGVFR